MQTNEKMVTANSVTAQTHSLVKDSGSDDLILDVRDLKVFYPIYGGVFYRRIGTIKAVDRISFTLKKGEILGLVGESGCGKSTAGKALINLLKATVPGVEIEGQILFNTASFGWVDLAPLSRRQMLPIRSEIQMIFQDPQSSLNPRLNVQQIVEEPLQIHRPSMSKNERLEYVSNLLAKVGLNREQQNRYPHEFSGGQKQRIGIARALASHPKLIIADEPVSALDVSIQAQVINLLQDLQKEFGFSYVFIAHDLSVVEHISNRIAVMYLGNIVEIGPAHQVYRNPIHPYSQALLSSVPRPDPKRKKERVLLKGEIPSPAKKPSGCGFRTRCPIAKSDCANQVPPLLSKGNDRLAACPYV